RIPDGGQRRSGNGLRVARPRPLRRDLARHQGRRADPVVRAVRGRHVRPRQPDRRLALRAGRPAHPPPLMPWPWRRLARNRLSFAALGAILVVTVAALLAPWLAPYAPDQPAAAAALASISEPHPLATDLYARLIRGEMLKVRETEYAEAARTVCNRPHQIVLYHLFPNCVPPLIVQATLAMGFAILTVAALSFIGLGIQPPQSEWGQMTAE